MPSRFDHCANVVRRLADAALRLEAAVESFGLAPLGDREWFELLSRKLIPQLGDESFLIVAVVGGTNIGKSVIFNHITGTRISATSPLASGTKHPVALLHPELLKRANLAQLFPGFELRRWEHAEQPLEDASQHRLFWTTTGPDERQHKAPTNLIILDTPDVDSVAQINWERADRIRQCSDVLIAVLTQQKYNDAAVKEFFRKAAREGKLVILVINQCLLPEDEAYWPLWIGTFCEETGIGPHSVYLAPNDRQAAEANALPFLERSWPISENGMASGLSTETGAVAETQPGRDLRVELSELKFGEIKVRTLAGALHQLLDGETGVPGWFREIDRRAEEFRHALEILSSHRLVEIDRWPTLPNAVMITQIRHWWQGQREGWTASIHNFYNRVGEIVVAPVNVFRSRSGPPRSPLDTYRQREWEAVLEVLERTLERLEWIKGTENSLLAPRLEKILNGVSRGELIRRVRKAHAEVDFERDLQQLIAAQLAHFQEESPQSYKLFRRVDSLAAATRPAVSVVLFMAGAGPVGEAVMPVVADTAMQGVFHVAGNAVGGTVVTAVGDKALTEGASTGMGYLEARFRQLHVRFAQQRVEWMTKQLEELFRYDMELETNAAPFQSESRTNGESEAKQSRTLTGELREASLIAECRPYRDLQAVVEELREVVASVIDDSRTDADQP